MKNNYYHFELKHKGYISNVISELKWKYNGKELQNELDLNWYDLGARNLDHALGRFMNVDPKAEQYNFQSIYAFANNNPVLFIDINGEGVDTDFKLNKSGKITRVNENDGSEMNKNDRLFATDKNGNVDSSKSVLINKKEARDQTLISDLSVKKEDGTSSVITGSKNQDKLFQLFLFNANNSDVEWSAVRGMQKGKETFGIGTAHNLSSSIKFESMGFKLNDMIAEVHSHVPTYSFEDENGSLFGDRARYQNYFKMKDNTKDMFSYYVYMKKSGNLWSVQSYFSTGEWIRNIEGNHKRFFFGTLNSK